MSERKRKDTKVSRWLKRRLADPAPIEFQDIDAMAGGAPQKLVGEVIAENVTREAMKGERWAIELTFDRSEGKPIQAVKDDASDRSVEERLEDVTRHHLNQLALAAGGEPLAAAVGADSLDAGDADRERDERRADPGDDRPGTTRGLLDLPRDGGDDPEDPQDEP